MTVAIVHVRLWQICFLIVKDFYNVVKEGGGEQLRYLEAIVPGFQK